MAKLYVIAGHGEGDSGATGNGYQEQERVRALARRIVELGDGQVDNYPYSQNCYARNDLSRINPGCPVIELHLDSASGARGGHVIIAANAGGADSYDNALASFISGMFPGRSKTIVERSDLQNPNAALRRGINYRLIECCFISSADDMAKFNSNLDDVARGILDAFGISQKPVEDLSRVVQVYPSNGNDSQKWNVKENDDGTVSLQIVASGKFLDVSAAKYESGNPVIAWKWHGEENQRWHIVDRGDGLVSLHPLKAESLCADIQGGDGKSGDRIILWPFKDQRNQLWHRCPNADGTVTYITSMDRKLALDVYKGGIA